MVVRRNSDRPGAFFITGATYLPAEGTIIGDGRTWNTVQLVPANSLDELNTTAVGAATQVASGDRYFNSI